MRNHPAILLASIIILMGGERVWAHGGSASHSSVGRGGTHARSVGLTPTRVSQMTRVQFHASPIGFGTNPAPGARMLVTTAQSVPTKPASVHPTSTAADPPPSPAADPPAPSAASAATSATTASTASSGAPQDLSQFNTGAQDVATPAISPPTSTDITSISSSGSQQLLGANGLELATPAISAPLTTASATTTTIGSSILNVANLMLPNTSTSGAVPQAAVTAAILPPTAAIVGTEGEVIATSGGSSITGGATGRNMPECMAAWDKDTHMTKTKWREVCARTLTEEHMY